MGPHRSGHPDLWALRYYGASPAALHRTDLQGRIVIRGARDGTYEVTFACLLRSRLPSPS